MKGFCTRFFGSKARSKSLCAFFNITTLAIPQSIENIFKQVSFELPHISFRVEKEEQRLFLQSYITIYGKRLLNKMIIHRDDKGIIGGSLYVGLPPEWSLKKELPEVGKRFVKNPHNPAFIISSVDFNDEQLGILVKKGLNFTGSVSIKDIPDSPITKKIKTSIGKIIKEITVHIVIPERMRDARTQFIALNLDDTVIPLQDLVNLEKTTMPRELKAALKNMGLIAPKISFTIDADIAKFLINEFMIKGGAVFGKTPVGVRFLARKNNPYDDDQNDNPAIPNVSLEVQLPMDWSFSDSFDGAKHFDVLDVDQASIILSNFKYDHQEIPVEVFRGVNFVSNVELKGALHKAQEFIDKILGKFMAVDNTGSFALSGQIGATLSNSSFSIDIPARIGVDFDQLYKKKIMSFKMPIFKKVMTSGLELQLRSRIADEEGRPPTVGFEFTTGLDIELRTQDDPISLLTTIEVEPDLSEISGYMKGIIDPAGIKWLALGELGVDLSVDYNIFTQVLAATGLPLPTGFGMRGLMLLGEPGKNRAEVELAGKFSLSSTGDNDFILLGRGEHIDLTHLVWLFGRMVDKKLSLNDAPPLKFDKLYIKVVPRSAELAQKEYAREFAATAWFDLFGYKGGMDVSVNRIGVTGVGRLSRIDQPWFKLSAPDSVLKKLAEEEKKEQKQETVSTAELSLKEFLQDKDNDGPQAILDINLFKQRISLMGKVEIPPLKLSKEVEIDVSFNKFKFRIEENWFGLYETEFDISIGNKAKDSYIKGRMKQSALTKFDTLIQKAATQFRKKATADLLKTQADLNEAIAKINKLKKKIRNKKKRCV